MLMKVILNNGYCGQSGQDANIAFNKRIWLMIVFKMWCLVGQMIMSG